MSEIMSAGEAARRLGISRDNLIYAIRRSGAPEPKTRVGGKRAFCPEDLEKLRKWLEKNRKYDLATA